MHQFVCPYFLGDGIFLLDREIHPVRTESPFSGNQEESEAESESEPESEAEAEAESEATAESEAEPEKSSDHTDQDNEGKELHFCRKIVKGVTK